VLNWECPLPDVISARLDRIAYCRIGIKIIRYLCKHNLNENMDTEMFTLFLENITNMKFIERKCQLSSQSNRHHYVSSKQSVKCPECSRNIIDSLSVGWQLEVPEVSSISQWMEYLSLDFDYFKEYAWKIWRDESYPIKAGGKTYIGLLEYLDEAFDGRYKQILSNLQDSFLAISQSLSYYDAGTVTTLVSMLVHQFHLPDVAVIFADTMRVQKCKDENLLITIPGSVKRVICISQDVKENHFVVFDIDLPMRQIFAYDGLDDSIVQWSSFIKNRPSKNTSPPPIASSVTNWQDYVADLLVTLSLRNTSSRSRTGVKVKVATGKTAVRKNKC